MSNSGLPQWNGRPTSLGGLPRRVKQIVVQPCSRSRTRTTARRRLPSQRRGATTTRVAATSPRSSAASSLGPALPRLRPDAIGRVRQPEARVELQVQGSSVQLRSARLPQYGEVRKLAQMTLVPAARYRWSLLQLKAYVP